MGAVPLPTSHNQQLIAVPQDDKLVENSYICNKYVCLAREI